MKGDPLYDSLSRSAWASAVRQAVWSGWSVELTDLLVESDVGEQARLTYEAAAVADATFDLDSDDDEYLAVSFGAARPLPGEGSARRRKVEWLYQGAVGPALNKVIWTAALIRGDQVIAARQFTAGKHLMAALRDPAWFEDLMRRDDPEPEHGENLRKLEEGRAAG